VNLTARLEGLTKFYGVSILISQQAYDHLSNPNHYQIRFLDRVVVKGRTEPIGIYEVFDAEPNQMKRLKIQAQADFEQGLADYRHRRLESAHACFLRVLAINPDDQTAALYLDRVQHLLEHGIPEGWNGIWTFTHK